MLASTYYTGMQCDQYLHAMCWNLILDSSSGNVPEGFASKTVNKKLDCSTLYIFLIQSLVSLINRHNQLSLQLFGVERSVYFQT